MKVPVALHELDESVPIPAAVSVAVAAAGGGNSNWEARLHRQQVRRLQDRLPRGSLSLCRHRAVAGVAAGKPAASSRPPPSSPRTPPPLHNPPNVLPYPVCSPHDVPRRQLRDIQHGQLRHRDTTTPSHEPHALRRPVLVTGPRTAPRGHLRHATRDCPLQSLRATGRSHSTRLGYPRSWPSPARLKLKRAQAHRAATARATSER